MEVAWEVSWRSAEQLCISFPMCNSAAEHHHPIVLWWIKSLPSDGPWRIQLRTPCCCAICDAEVFLRTLGISFSFCGKIFLRWGTLLFSVLSSALFSLSLFTKIPYHKIHLVIQQHMAENWRPPYLLTGHVPPCLIHWLHQLVKSLNNLCFDVFFRGCCKINKKTSSPWLSYGHYCSKLLLPDHHNASLCSKSGSDPGPHAALRAEGLLWGQATVSNEHWQLQDRSVWEELQGDGADPTDCSVCCPVDGKCPVTALLTARLHCA